MRHFSAPVRTGTWNVEGAAPGKNEKRLAKIRAADADVWVLTETRGALDLGTAYTATIAHGLWTDVGIASGKRIALRFVPADG